MTSVNPEVSFEEFEECHENQLISSGVPRHFWKSLFRKLKDSNFDAGEYFSLMEGVVDEGGNKWRVVLLKDIQSNGEDSIFLIDHAWTFRPLSARQQLESIPKLLHRMADLMDISYDNEDKCLEKVLSEMWKFAGTYSIGNAATVENKMPIWYINDEFGSRIRHSDEPNFRLVPIFSLIDNMAYSILFPIKDCKAEDEVTRDFVEGPDAANDKEIRRALLTAWNSENDFSEEKSWSQKEPQGYFFESGRKNETLPEDIEPAALPIDRKIRVYSEYANLNAALKHQRFEFTNDMSDADILWLTSHFKEYKELSESFPNKMINQFPFENVVTIKDLLCIVSRRMKTREDSSLDDPDPDWLPVTYNLKTELPEFISFFQNREKRCLDNHWIVKPWNLARSLDTLITPHLHIILRLPFSGPKIAQKYLHNPVLFQIPEVGMVKFDIRYIVLLRSVSPLKLYAYNRFWLRFANQPFDLNQFDIYEKHFTVMNYENSSNLKQMYCNDFINDFEKQYPSKKWKGVENKIFSAFKKIFEGATSKPPPCGIGRSVQSRAMYAIDLMLDWKGEEIIPKILEVNWGPDCDRACDYYEDFFDNVFSTLYLDETENQNVTQL